MGFQFGAREVTRRAAVTLAVLAGLGFLAGCRGAGAAAAPAATLSASAVAAMQGTQSPASLVAAASNDMLFAGSVQDVVTTTGPGGTITGVSDASVSSGRQVITLRLAEPNGTITTGRLTILLVNRVCYVSGDETGLNRVVGLGLVQADQVLGRWIAVQQGEQLGQADYTSISSGMTLNDLASSVALTGRLTPAAPGTIGGQPARGVQGTDPGGGGLARLYVTDTDAPLPVTFTVPGGKEPFQMSFRHWGEPVHLTPPPDPIPASSVTPNSATA